jgi:RHS repeat-associated protein
VQVSYLPSTKYDNTDRTWTNDPWAAGARSLLPFPVYTVSSTVVNDGFGNVSTNTYSYKHGFYEPVSREFRGFNRVAVTDPYGAQTVTYFHQSGGFNDAIDGEYEDPGSFSKKGIPYRVETWGTNGLLYQIVLNKVVENVLNTNGWYFPDIAQTTVMNYEGLSSYRATAAQFSYSLNTENLTNEVDFGEVTNVVFNGQTFTDVGNDSVYKWMTYTNIGNILNLPSDVKITSDSAGANRLQETLDSYDASGNPKVGQSWLSTAGAFITTVSNNYDQYGNRIQTTDAAGITTTATYDSTFEQFPVSSTTGTFTSSSTFDNRSGLVVTDTDAKGLVSSNVYDVFFRPTANYISTNSYGPPVLWQSFTTYSLGGISGGVSQNYVFSQVNNAVNEVSGFQTYTYSDGLGRTIETRAESETSGQDRVANTVYDLRGNPYFATLSYFSSGTAYTAPGGTYLGSLTTYDSIGRAFQTTPAVNGTFTSGLLTGVSATGGDTSSPVGAATTAFVDGNNPWATVVTDANGKVRKSYRDAYGRTIQTLDIASVGNVSTTYAYDLIGDLTNVTDNVGNSTVMGYDSLGRKVSMIDPDMGAWSYTYDNDNRMTQQIDAKHNTIDFFYNDQLGRLTAKQIYNSSGTLTGTITYAYDTSSDPNYAVYPGQLYKVTDLQGYERFSYDVRGRVLKDARLLSANAIEYLTQATYDDADRIQQLTYPGNAATIQYTYDVAGHLSQVASTAGTGTNETFYIPRSFNAIGQLTGYTNGNGVVTTYGYFANSQRLQNLATTLGGTSYQNLSYTYDNVADVSSINDGVYSGSASASVSSIAYDDLYRITSLNSTARGAKTYGYSSIGNILTNQDFGPGVYQYGAKPHAVTSANGVNYGYDACGNMTNRGNQTLTFDAQNQLVQVTTTNDSVAFGYDDNGERLWRAGTNGYAIWIGGIYEINNGKVLCHVMAGGQLIATFEPQCNAGLARVFGEKNWFVASGKISAVFAWPFRQGRGQWTMLGGTWAGIIVLCMLGGRGVRLKRHEIRRAFGLSAFWRQAVTVLCISAFLAGSIGDVEAAPTYNPVFYFYHPDALGSSNILTDRSGNLVQHYEYATFGQTSYQNNTSAFPVSSRYTGQIADDETGLYYYGGRYYDPQLGRFIQPDPTVPDPTDSQSFNRYSYCRNNPLNQTDPSGFDDDGGDDGGGWGDIGNLLGGTPGGWLGDAIDAYNNLSSLSFTSFSQELADGSTEYGFDLSAGDTFGGGWDFRGGDTVSASGNLVNAGLQYMSWVPPTVYDGGVIPGSTYSISVLANFVQPAAQAPTSTPTVSSGGGWLSAVTNAAGLLSLIPGPVGTLAGLINAGGEALQGNYLAAGIGVGGALLAGIGLGIVGKLAQEATTGEKLLLDTNVVIGQGKQFVASGQNIMKASITDVELVSLVKQGRIGMPSAASQIPSVANSVNVDLMINVRGLLTPKLSGNYVDGIIGATAIEQGATLISNDKSLINAVNTLGGIARKP